MAVDERAKGETTVDVKVRIPELEDIGAFWVRQYPLHRTFRDLHELCLNHPEVQTSKKSLAHSRASRHFWCGERLMRRKEPISAALSRGGEISLVLRPDLYHVGPPSLLRPDIEYTYLDAEAPLGEIIVQILSRDERSRCFDLCRGTDRRRLAREKSLADHGLWPAWQDAPVSEFPVRARLLLRARSSWLAQALLVVAALLGTAIGYFLL